MANLFFSYSHKDEELRNELEVHLSMLKRQGLIDSWHDRRIEAGDEIDPRIAEKLENSDIVLLLVSANFLASDYCYEREMMRALERNEEGNARVVPVILHPCDWHNAPFGNLRATPSDGIPVSLFANQDEALTQVAKEIREIVENMGVSPKETNNFDIDSKKPLANLSSLRSSNLRVKKQFSDKQVDDFLDSTFDYISQYFEASLHELQKRNDNITTKFKRVDTDCFVASIYDEGTKASECTIWTGGDSAFVGGIAFFGGITTSRNQFNESMSVENDGYSMHLKPLGMSRYGMREEMSLSQEGAAELYWELLIRKLQ